MSDRISWRDLKIHRDPELEFTQIPLSIEERFYSKTDNVDALRYIEVSMMSGYLKHDVERCKNTVREFWDLVKAQRIQPATCVAIDKKCDFIFQKILQKFSESAVKLKTKFSIVDAKTTLNELDYVRASIAADQCNEPLQQDLILLDYYILRSFLVGAVFIKHLLRFHTKLTIADVENEQIKREDSAGEFYAVYDDLPDPLAMRRGLIEASPVENLIEDEWKLVSIDARNFTVQYPSCQGSKREEFLQKSLTAWKNLMKATPNKP
ncbi:MAG: hypothetical protein JSR58_07125 [Verrucomicrobia bacterium]|nr:hypothetical protein [Verrucomicrobiota bacterium]